MIHPPKYSPAWSPTEGNSGDEQKASASKQPKSRYGRWTAERYDAAQTSLVKILHHLGANSPHKAILRPILREEARKVIGDTGLLDHLLKHLADQVVSPIGEKLRRRHNREGHMEYWLQDPGSAVAEEEMLKQEMHALSTELREIREARNMLQTVRDEAAAAIRTVKGVSQGDLDVGASFSMEKSITNLGAILDGISKDVVNVEQRLSLVEADVQKMNEAVSMYRLESMGQIYQTKNKMEYVHCRSIM